MGNLKRRNSEGGMMNYTEFVRLVYDMRRAQQDYFDRRTRSALELAKSLERRVDREALQILGDQVNVEQVGMFDHLLAGDPA